MLHQDAEDDGMEMEMEVAVDVVEFQAGAAEERELRVHLGLDLRLQLRAEEVAQADGYGVVGEVARGIGQTGNLLGGQCGLAHEEREVKADTEARILAGEFDGFRSGVARDHQAGGGEDAVAMGLDDGGVDAAGAAEVVGIDDEPTPERGVRAFHSSE